VNIKDEVFDGLVVDQASLQARVIGDLRQANEGVCGGFEKLNGCIK
jgi:hypothetical protein